MQDCSLCRTYRVGNGLVYSSRHVDDARAQQTLLGHVEGEVLTQPRVLRFRPGQRREAWRGNCVAVGLAAGFLEPLESTSIYLIQRAIIRLLQLFPRAGLAPADIAEFNQQTRDDIEHIRDFIVLHFHVTERQDTPYWQACRDLDIPASLRHRIELFSDTARVFRVGGELFGENSWIQVMLGQGLLPAQHHPVADLMGDAELARFLDGIRTAVDRGVQGLPAHRAYVQKYCPAAGA